MSHMCRHFSDSSTKWTPSKCLFNHTHCLGTDQMFCNAISFTDRLEQFLRHIQNHHSQAAVLMIQFKFSRPILSSATIIWRRNNDLWEAFQQRKLLQSIFYDDFSDQNRPGELKLVLLELPRNVDSEYVYKIVLAFCEQNCIAKRLATPFPTTWGGGKGAVGQIGPQR
jgi:hypothetical protein